MSSEQDNTRHTPVMLREVLEALQPRDGGIYVDGTFGAGGYSRAILNAADCTLVAVDRDPDAIAGGQVMVKEYGERLILLPGRFAEMRSLLDDQRIGSVDGVVLDLGVSSMQLDTAERGFSFRFDGPLDMRMGGRADEDSPSAADVVNTLDERDLARIIGVYGEERFSRRIAKAIVRVREDQPFSRTAELADTVSEQIGAQRHQSRIHPATRTFQALRIYVNGELEQLAQGLCAAEDKLSPGGRLVVVSFHSLEDRIVKKFLAERTGKTAIKSRHLPSGSEDTAPSFTDIARGGWTPSDEEAELNSRSRSARLRAGERTTAASYPRDFKAMGLPFAAHVRGQVS